MIRKKTTKPNTLFFITIGVVLFAFILVWSNVQIHKRRVMLQEYIQREEEEKRVLRERIDRAREIDLSQPNNDFELERIAREQLLLKKPGEEVVFITFPEDTSPEKAKEEVQQFIWWNPFTW